MRELFPGYYTPSEERFKALWDECVFVFDANVLLNVYRYSPKTLKNFLDILKRLENRLWLPHQAALEYQRNRLTVISEQYQPYADIPKLINELLNHIGSSYPRHPFHCHPRNNKAAKHLKRRHTKSTRYIEAGTPRLDNRWWPSGQTGLTGRRQYWKAIR